MSDTSVTQRRKPTILTRQHERQLEDWIATVWESIETDRTAPEVIAKQAAISLGFAVSKHNAISAAKTIGKAWPKGDKSAHNAAVRTARMAVVVRQLVNLIGGPETDPVATPEFTTLCAELGVSVPWVSPTAPPVGPMRDLRNGLTGDGHGVYPLVGPAHTPDK